MLLLGKLTYVSRVWKVPSELGKSTALKHRLLLAWLKAQLTTYKFGAIFYVPMFIDFNFLCYFWMMKCNVLSHLVLFLLLCSKSNSSCYFSFPFRIIQNFSQYSYILCTSSSCKICQTCEIDSIIPSSQQTDFAATRDQNP